MNEEPISVPQISSLERIPPNFLEQLLIKLRRAGMIKSTRGKKGGYTLAVPPESISILNVIEAIEGKYGLAKCLIPGEQKGCTFSVSDCVLRSVWNRLQPRIEEILSEITIAHIIQENLLRERAKAV